MAVVTADEQLKRIESGIEELLPRDEFADRLGRSVQSGVPLRVKQGFDPTAPDIHLGHTVGLRKLRQFQDLGHQVVLIVGDYTGLVGDPSGRSATRPQLTMEEIESNAQTYLTQFFKVVDEHKTDVIRNSKWFAPMGMRDVILLCARYTVARTLERDDFSKRMAAHEPISVHELLYPLMQGFDSVMIRCDLELGATEQKFNLLVGRALQEDYARGEMAWCERYIPEAVRKVPVPRQGQIVLTLPILVGTDGKQRMSKSLGNYIGVSEPANIIWEKLMRVPDESLGSFLKLLLNEGERIPLEERLNAGFKQRHAGQSQEGGNLLREVHRGLARAIVTEYHGAAAAEAAGVRYEEAGRGGAVPSKVVELPPTPEEATWIGYVAVKAGLAKSTTEARNLLKDGGLFFLSESPGSGQEAWTHATEQQLVPSGPGAPAFCLRRGKRQETTVMIVWTANPSSGL